MISLAPMRLAGGRIYARSTTVGRPFSSSIETSASPTPSSAMTFSVSSFALARIVAATAF